jgi:sulfatase modifying factor 1
MTLNINQTVKKVLYFLIILFIFSSCSKSDRGELVGIQGKKFFPDKPSGMVLVPSGSFLMGMSDEDIVGLQNAPISTVSVKAFYMDETEITNGEYRQFVNWVKDSIVRQALAVRAMEEIGESPTQEELDKDNSINSFFPLYQPISEVSDEEKTGYELYREQNSFGINPYDKKTFNLNFDIDIIWEREDYPDLAYAEVMEGVIEGTGFYFT